VIVFLFAMVLLVCLSCASKSLPEKGITILSPKANDVFKAGDFYQILWKAEPAKLQFGAKMTLEFSKGGSKLWDFRGVLGEVKERIDRCIFKCLQPWEKLNIYFKAIKDELLKRR